MTYETYDSKPLIKVTQSWVLRIWVFWIGLHRLLRTSSNQVQKEKFDFLGLLKIHDAKTCSAVLISCNWIVTAAHCVDQIKSENIVVDFELENKEKNGREIVSTLITGMYIHPMYNKTDLNHDIALLKTKFPPRKVKILSLALNDSDIFLNNKTLKMAGYGSNLYKGPIGKMKYLSHIHVIDNKSAMEFTLCKDLHESLFCVEDVSDTKSICNGDSGAPLWDSESMAIVGLVSHGVSCKAGSPSVFLRVSEEENRKFINRYVFRPSWDMGEFELVCEHEAVSEFLFESILIGFIVFFVCSIVTFFICGFVQSK